MDDRKTLRALEEAAVFDRRTPLFLWMYRHHAEFAEMVRKAGKPNWKAMATQFVKEGLLPQDRKYDTVRQTWIAVRKALEREARDDHRLPQSAAQPRDEFFHRHDETPLADNDFSDIERIR